MCGIAAAVPGDRAFVESVLARQAHRGPDPASVDLGFCTLGVNRLAISGLDGGAQPLTSTDGSIVVVFNGAIYNAAMLVDAFGMQPKSSNDGEVIAFLYQRFGMDFADHLEGMFAICLADLRTGELVVAVDDLGIKPVFVCEAGDHRYVASEVAAFPAPLRRSVRRLPPGVVWSSAGRLQRIAHAYHSTGSLHSLLAASVREQIPAEVPWGCLLSGGVDSSLIARLASDVAAGLPTFACGIEGSSDLAAARRVAELLGTDHHEVVVDPEELPAVVDAVVERTASPDPWTVMTGVGCYLAARRAAERNIKVLLSGEGADEMFGGYQEFEALPAAFLNTTLVQYQADLGVTECLRLDRATMAHSIEGRVPFLSTSLLRYARALPPGDKVKVEGAATTRKYALRQLARSVLPGWVADRPKVEFAMGAGIHEALLRIAEEAVPADRLASLRTESPGFPIDGAVSAWVFTRWREIFGDSIADSWESLAHRGLVRQRASIYSPGVADPSFYR